MERSPLAPLLKKKRWNIPENFEQIENHKQIQININKQIELHNAIKAGIHPLAKEKSSIQSVSEDTVN